MPKKSALQEAADAYRALLRNLLQDENAKTARKTEASHRKKGFSHTGYEAVGRRAVLPYRLETIVEKSTPTAEEVHQVPLDYGLRNGKDKLQLERDRSVSKEEMIALGMAWVELVQAAKDARRAEREDARSHASRAEKSRTRLSRNTGDHYGMKLQMLMCDRYYVLGVTARSEDRFTIEPPKGINSKKGISTLEISNETLINQGIISKLRNGVAPTRDSEVKQYRQQLLKLLTWLKATSSQAEEILDGYDAAVRNAQRGQAAAR